MRKITGWICYFVGGLTVIGGLQIVIACELLAAFKNVPKLQLGFWDFLFVSSGLHHAFPNGYVIHLMRDLFVLGWALLIIGVGREQFNVKPKTRADKTELVTCPECKKKTYSNAYCRFCGFNLVTHESLGGEDSHPWPIWQVSLLAYCGVSILLLILNLIMIKAG